MIRQIDTLLSEEIFNFPNFIVGLKILFLEYYVYAVVTIPVATLRLDR